MTAPGLGATPTGLWGAATELSRGKDTPSGHWELAGVPVSVNWTYFPSVQVPAFPPGTGGQVCDLAGTVRHFGQLPNAGAGYGHNRPFGAEHAAQ